MTKCEYLGWVCYWPSLKCVNGSTLFFPGITTGIICLFYAHVVSLPFQNTQKHSPVCCCNYAGKSKLYLQVHTVSLQMNTVASVLIPVVLLPPLDPVVRWWRWCWVGPATRRTSSPPVSCATGRPSTTTSWGNTSRPCSSRTTTCHANARGDYESTAFTF